MSAPAVMRRRVEETLDLLGIADLRRRPLRALSGGQQQRVAIASVLTTHPEVLVLDEPTSALDPTAAEEVLATLARLVHDLGKTIVVAEHRMERVVPFADRIAYVVGDGSVEVGEPAEILRRTPIAPPLVELGRLAGWDPLPLSVRDARRHPPPRFDALPTAPAPKRVDKPSNRGGGGGGGGLTARGVVVRYGARVAVRGVDLALSSGEVTALMGRNGSGKSSLLWALQGSGPRQGGSVDAAGADPRDLSRADARRRVGLVPQSASDLLYLESVAAECVAGDEDAGAATGTCRALLEDLTPGVDDALHPRDLSEGQKLALVLAVQLAAAPAVMLLDEPTRGLDYTGKEVLARMVSRLATDGHAVVVATHDVEFVATVADRVVVMAEGEIVSDGPTADVLTASPAFAPQVAKVLGPPWLTVAQVRDALTSEVSP